MRTAPARCGTPLGLQLSRLGVRRIDYFTLDVEGQEADVVGSLDFGTLSIGVLVVEVRPDGTRAAVISALMAAGMAYVGQIHGRPSTLNDVIDDVLVNFSHFERFLPSSRVRALRERGG